MRRTTDIARFILLLFIGSGICAFNAASTDANDEQRIRAVKTAYIFNFIKYTEWPDDVITGSDEPIVIGLIGESSFAGNLAMLTEKKTKGKHPLELRVLQMPTGDVADLTDDQVKTMVAGCHLIYFPCESSKTDWQPVLRFLSNNEILTISDCPSFTTKGGMVCFEHENERIVFRICLTAVQKARVKISSKLLVLAKEVLDDCGEK